MATVVKPATPGTAGAAASSSPVVVPHSVFAGLAQRSLDTALQRAAFDEVVVTSSDDSAAGLAATIKAASLATLLGAEEADISDTWFPSVWAATKAKLPGGRVLRPDSSAFHVH